MHQPPVMTVKEDNEDQLKEEAKKIVDENLLILLEENKTEPRSSDETPQVTSSSAEDSPIYFRLVFGLAVSVLTEDVWLQEGCVFTRCAYTT